MEKTRALRRWLGNDRRFLRFDLQAQRLGDLRAAGPFRRQLETARVDVSGFAERVPLQIRVAEFSELSLAHVRAAELRGTWNRVAGAADQAFIVLVRRGSLELARSGYASVRGEGAFVVLPGSGPVAFESSGELSELVCMSVPGRVAAAATTSSVSGLVHSQQHGVADAVFAPAAALVASNCALAAPDVTDGDPLQAVVEEAARAVVRLAGGLRDAAEQTLFDAAVALIRSGFDSAGFNGETLAQSLGVSLRTLQSAFREEGRTVAGVIRQARAVGAVRLSHEQPQLSQARIAALSGFGSVDSLQRALRIDGSGAEPLGEDEDEDEGAGAGEGEGGGAPG